MKRWAIFDCDTLSFLTRGTYESYSDAEWVLDDRMQNAAIICIDVPDDEEDGE